MHFYQNAKSGFAIIAVYVDDLNLVGTPEEITRAANYLIVGTPEEITRVANYMKEEFEMKDLGKTKYCFGLQMEQLST